ncbi:MAG: YbaK/EbsC family protein, partial [Candidatus Kariarchaeaceae archaeon]
RKKSKIALIIIRGDMEVNEYKIKQVLGVDELKVATDDEIRSIGCVPGFASAIGMDRTNSTVIVDEMVPKSKNLVAGANKEKYHLINTNYDRDYTADIITDIALVTDKSLCIECESRLEIKLGIPLVTNIITNKDSPISYLNNKGKPLKGQTIASEFDITKILGALSLVYDKFGIQLPIQISPFQLVLLTIGSDPKVHEMANKVYSELNPHYEILFDNREVKLGVKLADADLRSIPFRLILSDTSIESNEVEFSERGSKERVYFALEEILTQLRKLLI